MLAIILAIVEPPRGHAPTLKRYMDSRPDLACSLNMFGFGYNLKSNLLDEMAREGNGYYTYIPDSGMVGTGFINAAAKTMASDCDIDTFYEPLYDMNIMLGQQDLATNGQESLPLSQIFAVNLTQRS